MDLPTTEAEQFRAPVTRRLLLKHMGVAGSLLAFPSLLAACGDADEAGGTTSSAGAGVGDGEAPAELRHLRWALPVVASLDAPTQSFHPGSVAASALALEGLLHYDENLQLVGAVAESWEAVDPLTYVYKLRPGVQFWDGTDVTADDVVFSIQRHVDPDTGSQLSSYVTSVESVSATADDEVTVTLSVPDPFWQHIPIFTIIVPRSFVEAQGDNFGAPGTEVSVMGTGPYRVTEFRADELVSFEKNPGYWGEAGPFEEISISVIDDPQTRLLAMQAGDIDGTFLIQPTDATDWNALDGVTVTAAPGMRTAFFSFDMSVEPWSDVHVRRAVAHALDRTALVDSVLGGFGKAATSMVPRDQWLGMVPDNVVDDVYAALAVYEFDLDKAREELALSAFPDGFTATVDYANVRPDLGKVAQTLSENLSQIGVELEVVEVPIGEFIAALSAHEDLGFRIASFGPDYADPGNFVSYMFPSQFAVPNAYNLANYMSQEVDDLLVEQSESIDPVVRADRIGRVMALASEDLPYLPVWWEDTVMAVGPGLAYEGFHAFFIRQAWTSNMHAT